MDGPCRRGYGRAMKRTLAALLSAAVLIGCASGGADDEPAAEAPPATSTVPAEDPTPAGYLAALAKVAPGLPDKRATNAAENTCLDVEQGKEKATLVRNLAGRLEVDEAKAEDALPVVRKFYCPAG